MYGDGREKDCRPKCHFMRKLMSLCSRSSKTEYSYESCSSLMVAATCQNTDKWNIKHAAVC